MSVSALRPADTTHQRRAMRYPTLITRFTVFGPRPGRSLLIASSWAGFYNNWSFRFATRFRIKSVKAVPAGDYFRFGITLDTLIARSCDHIPIIFEDQFPCPSGKTFHIARVVIAVKVESTTITIIVELIPRIALVIEPPDFVVHGISLET